MTPTVRLALASILPAFEQYSAVVGSKVTNREFFLASVSEAVERFDFTAANPTVTTPGQGRVELSRAACAYVSSGVGKHVNDPAAYVLRSWRGSVGAYLKRNHAAPVDSVAVMVYTVDAYLADPQVAADADEVSRIRDLWSNEGPTHVIVAVLASSGPPSPLSPGRLVSNLAGGNKDALAWNADTIRAKARESAEYSNTWGVVAD
jgi:hypothetical protein